MNKDCKCLNIMTLKYNSNLQKVEEKKIKSFRTTIQKYSRCHRIFEIPFYVLQICRKHIFPVISSPSLCDLKVHHIKIILDNIYRYEDNFLKKYMKKSKTKNDII